MTLAPNTSQAQPSIDQVQGRLDTLYHQAEMAQERLNGLNQQMHAKQEHLKALQSDLRKERKQFQQTSDQVAHMAADEAQSPGSQLTSTQQLILSDDPDDFLSHLAAQQALSDHQGQMLGQFQTAAQRLDLRKRQVDQQLAEVSKDQKRAAKESHTVDSKVADAKDLLSHLKAKRRAALAARAEEASRAAPRPAPAVASGAAATAVAFAMDQVGDSYVYGAAGPDAWDCSGLTMGAWGAAGVSLPHSSSAQMSSGTPVDSSELQPGDLVFYYHPVSHVGMYIGNGQIVNAANPDSGVTTAPVMSMPYSGAVRPG